MGKIEKWCIELGLSNESKGPSGGLREFGRVFDVSPSEVARANRGEAVGIRMEALMFTLVYLKKKGLHNDYAKYCRKHNKKVG